MTDDLARQLFVKDGNQWRDWELVDEAMRLHYRLATQTNSCVASGAGGEDKRRAEIDIGYQFRAPA